MQTLLKIQIYLTISDRGQIQPVEQPWSIPRLAQVEVFEWCIRILWFVKVFQAQRTNRSKAAYYSRLFHFPYFCMSGYCERATHVHIFCRFDHKGAEQERVLWCFLSPRIKWKSCVTVFCCLFQDVPSHFLTCLQKHVALLASALGAALPHWGEISPSFLLMYVYEWNKCVAFRF